MGVSIYEADNRLNQFRGVEPPAVPADFFVSLHTADPGTTGASQLAGGGYARQPIAAEAESWTAPATNAGTRRILISEVLSFGPATGADWPTATHGGIWDAATGGNFIRGFDLPVDKTVQVGDRAEFAANSLSISETIGT